MSEITRDRPWTTYWIKSFKKDLEHGKKRFKRLNKGYPQFEIDEDLIETVEFYEFIKIETYRIPLFIGSQFGVNPRIDNMPDFFNGDKIIAILNKSLLSGRVAGLCLYKIDKNDKKLSYYKTCCYEN